LDPPAKIINMSLGGGGTDPYMEEVLRKAAEAGSIIIAASGNDSNYEGSDWVSVGYPASSEYTICAGATNEKNSVTQYSNIGATLDIFAPGGEFLDGDPEGGILCVHADPSGPTYGYAWYTGTSFATPYASGIAGLLCSIDSSLDNEEMRELFQKSTVSMDPPYFDLFSDVGLLDALLVFETYAGGRITDVDLTRIPADSPGDQPPVGPLFPTVPVKRTSGLPEYNPETIIITFPDGTTEAEQQAAIDELGLERVTGSRNVYHADLQATSLSSYQTRLEAQTPGIKVYRNYYYYAY
jgi:subtilisin family serine protease